MKEFKQVILVRDDLKMSKGKLAVQVSHASVDALMKSDKKIVEEWRKEGMKKVVLKVENLEELKKFETLAKKECLKTALIKDAGLTEFSKAEITCLGIGPEEGDKIDKVTGRLKML